MQEKVKVPCNRLVNKNASFNFYLFYKSCAGNERIGGFNNGLVDVIPNEDTK